MARRRLEDLERPEFTTTCRHGFFTETPCDQQARWVSGHKAPESQWQACDQHRMSGDVLRENRVMTDPFARTRLSWSSRQKRGP